MIVLFEVQVEDDVVVDVDVDDVVDNDVVGFVVVVADAQVGTVKWLLWVRTALPFGEDAVQPEGA